MNDNLNNNNPMQPEEFDQLLRSKMNDHRVVPPRESWDAIATGLSAGTPQKLTTVNSSQNVRMYWISGAAAASVVLLFGLFALTDLFTSGVTVSSDQFDSTNSVSALMEENPISDDNQIIVGVKQLSENQTYKKSYYHSEKRGKKKRE